MWSNRFYKNATFFQLLKTRSLPKSYELNIKIAFCSKVRYPLVHYRIFSNCQAGIFPFSALDFLSLIMQPRNTNIFTVLEKKLSNIQQQMMQGKGLFKVLFLPMVSNPILTLCVTTQPLIVQFLPSDTPLLKVTAQVRV